MDEKIYKSLQNKIDEILKKKKDPKNWKKNEEPDKMIVVAESEPKVDDENASE